MMCQVMDCENEAHYIAEIDSGGETIKTMQVFLCKECLLKFYFGRQYSSEDKEGKILEEHKVEELLDFMLRPPAE